MITRHLTLLSINIMRKWKMVISIGQIPYKFIPFSGPLNVTDKYGSFTPDDYVPIFKKMGVTLVVRLNKPQYDKKKFTKAGIKHLDLYFLDGSTPPDHIVD